MKLSVVGRAEDSHQTADGKALQFPGMEDLVGGVPKLSAGVGVTERHFLTRAVDGFGSLMHIVWKDVYEAGTDRPLTRVPLTHPTSLVAAREAIHQARLADQRQRGHDSQVFWITPKHG